MPLKTNYEHIQELKEIIKKLEDRITFLENFVEMDFKLRDK
tara:strand:- start:1485 stop:1607 length:123 start_codon:yes stop_codon:yes gene_type:complete